MLETRHDPRPFNSVIKYISRSFLLEQFFVHWPNACMLLSSACHDPCNSPLRTVILRAIRETTTHDRLEVICFFNPIARSVLILEQIMLWLIYSLYDELSKNRKHANAYGNIWWAVFHKRIYGIHLNHYYFLFHLSSFQDNNYKVSFHLSPSHQP